MVKIILMMGAILMLWSSNATAQERIVGGKCRADLQKLCPGIPPGDNRLRDCMREHIHDISLPCLVTLARFAAVRRLRPEVPTFGNSVRVSSVKGERSRLA